jgi:hypothetical protein
VQTLGRHGKARSVLNALQMVAANVMFLEIALTLDAPANTHFGI